jgi:hypothetical protein
MTDFNLNAPLEAARFVSLLTGASDLQAFDKCGGDPDTLRNRRIWPRYRDLAQVTLPAIDGGASRLTPKANRSYLITAARKLNRPTPKAAYPVDGPITAYAPFADDDLKAAKREWPSLARATHHSLWCAYAAYLLPVSGATRIVLAYNEAWSKQRLDGDDRDSTLTIGLPSMLAATPMMIEAACGATASFDRFLLAHGLVSDDELLGVELVDELVEVNQPETVADDDA